MMGWRRMVLAVLIAVVTSPAAGQVPTPAPATTAETRADTAAAPSKVWLLGGITFGALRGDCQTCEADFPYRQAVGVVGGGGYRANTRMDVGAEVFWMPVEYVSGQRIHTTHVDAVARFRPWASKGFTVKGGAGIAFVRNWVDVPRLAPFDSQALSVVIGAAWAFRPAARVGLEVFATQHAAALGDLQTNTDTVEDVVGNYWALGLAVTFR